MSAAFFAGRLAAGFIFIHQIVAVVVFLVVANFGLQRPYLGITVVAIVAVFTDKVDGSVLIYIFGIRPGLTEFLVAEIPHSAWISVFADSSIGFGTTFAIRADRNGAAVSVVRTSNGLAGALAVQANVGSGAQVSVFASATIHIGPG